MNIIANGQIINSVISTGNNVTITSAGRTVYVNGIQIDGTPDTLDIRIEGGVANVKAERGSITCGDVQGDVDAAGSVSCGNVAGKVDAGGSVSCDNVASSVSAGGSIKASKLMGSANAGGSISIR